MLKMKKEGEGSRERERGPALRAQGLDVRDGITPGQAAGCASPGPAGRGCGAGRHDTLRRNTS